MSSFIGKDKIVIASARQQNRQYRRMSRVRCVSRVGHVPVDLSCACIKNTKFIYFLFLFIFFLNLSELKLSWHKPVLASDLQSAISAQSAQLALHVTHASSRSSIAEMNATWPNVRGKQLGHEQRKLEEAGGRRREEAAARAGQRDLRDLRRDYQRHVTKPFGPEIEYSCKTKSHFLKSWQNLFSQKVWRKLTELVWSKAKNSQNCLCLPAREKFNIRKQNYFNSLSSFQEPKAF